MKRSLMLIIVIFPVYLFSQNGTVETAWTIEFTYDSLLTDGSILDLEVNHWGNVCAVGNIAGRWITVQYNADGTIAWGDIYDSPNESGGLPTALAMDDSGNVYVAGGTSAFSTGKDYTTMKYNRFGIQEWIAWYTGPEGSVDAPVDIALDNSGNIIVTGYSYWGEITGWDYATVKYDAAGEEVWSARFPNSGTGYEHACALTIDNAENVYVTGGRYYPDYSYVTVVYDSCGMKLWDRTFTRVGGDVSRASDLVVDTSGNVYVTGTTYTSETGSDYTTVKYDPNGNEVWIKHYNGPANGNDESVSIAIDEAGYLFVTGSSYGDETESDFATIKYDSDGTELWVARYNSSGNWSDAPRAMTLDTFGNVYVVGVSGGGEVCSDFATIKYNTNGTEEWVAHFNSSEDDCDEASIIAVDHLGNVFVAGTITRWGYMDKDWEKTVIIKYTQPNYAAIMTEAGLPEKPRLHRNYPNPFNPVSTIQYDLPTASDVSLIIYDILGREVARLVEGYMEPGHHWVQWGGRDTSSRHVPAGIYIARLVTPEYSKSIKMVLLK